jgi:hypothetical protein
MCMCDRAWSSPVCTLVVETGGGGDGFVQFEKDVHSPRVSASPRGRGALG